MNNLLMKNDLSAEQLAMVNSEMSKKQKSKGIAYALWFFLGTFAGHRFYSGDIGRAILMLLFGWATLFIWNFVDVFFIGKRIEQKNEQLETDIIMTVKALSNNKNAANT
ncbi:TM2 domain-containing protein [Neobacillus sp. NRS-1170]|uniref:TM2 domain-containing protein n=1 Tax=Neobacillus sp. NRS-1170 TaxID=3233898 RepID=UPI003D2B227E